MRLGPIEFDTGYGLLIIVGLAVWIGVPVINSVFGTSIMASTMSLPVVGDNPLYVVIGGGMALTGFLGYIGHRSGWW